MSARRLAQTGSLLPHLADVHGGAGKPAILRRAERLIPRLNAGALVVLDDIHHTREMEQLRPTICQRREFTHALGTTRFGLLQWGPGTAAPATYRNFGFRFPDLTWVRQIVRPLR